MLCILLFTSPDLKDLPKEVFAVDPGQVQNTEIAYRCRKCRCGILFLCPSLSLVPAMGVTALYFSSHFRRTLFCGSSILSHEMGSGPNAFPHKKIASSGHQSGCTSYFIEPVRWMEEALLGVMDGQVS